MTVALGDWRPVLFDPKTGNYAISNSFSAVLVPPSWVWSSTVEGSLPSGEATDAVLDRISGAEYDLMQLLELAAEAELTAQTVGVVDRPWDALLVLEIEQARVEAEYAHEFEEWNDAPRGGKRRPLRDFSVVLDMAQAVIAKHPEHVVADYARMYEMTAFADFGSTHYSEASLATAAMEAIRESSDIKVVDSSALILSNIGAAVDLTADDLDLLRGLYEDPDAQLSTRQLADIAMRSALHGNDLIRADYWASRYRQETVHYCNDELPDREISDAAMERQLELCRGAMARLDTAEGWLLAHDYGEHVSWRGVLAAVVRKCGKAHAEIPEPALTGEAIWTGVSWSFSSWIPYESELSACVESAQFAEPYPPNDTALLLHVIGRAKL